MKRNIFLKIITLLGFIILSFKTQTNSSFSQNYELIISWQANNYYPPNYQGKSLPVKNTNIALGVILTANNRIIDLNNFLISWYLDNQFFKEDYGLEEINFNVLKNKKTNHFITVEIYNKNNELITKKNLILPIQEPQIVLTPFIPQNFPLKENTLLNLEILPYFFNTTNLNNLIFDWQINNQQQTIKGDNKLNLTITTINNQQEKLIIKNKTHNENNINERAETFFEFTVIK